MKKLTVLIVLCLAMNAFGQKKTSDYTIKYLPLKNFNLYIEAGGGFWSAKDTKKLLGGYIHTGFTGISAENNFLYEVNARLLSSPTTQMEGMVGYMYDNETRIVHWDETEFHHSDAVYDYYKVLGTYKVEKEISNFLRAGIIRTDSDPYYEDNFTQGGKFTGGYLGLGRLERVNTEVNSGQLDAEITDIMAIDLIVGNGTEIEEKKINSWDENGVKTETTKLKFGGRAHYSMTGTSGFTTRFELGYITNYLYVTCSLGMNIRF